MTSSGLGDSIAADDQRFKLAQDELELLWVKRFDVCNRNECSSALRLTAQLDVVRKQYEEELGALKDAALMQNAQLIQQSLKLTPIAPEPQREQAHQPVLDVEQVHHAQLQQQDQLEVINRLKEQLEFLQVDKVKECAVLQQQLTESLHQGLQFKQALEAAHTTIVKVETQKQWNLRAVIELYFSAFGSIVIEDHPGFSATQFTFESHKSAANPQYRIWVDVDCNITSILKCDRDLIASSCDAGFFVSNKRKLKTGIVPLGRTYTHHNRCVFASTPGLTIGEFEDKSSDDIVSAFMLCMDVASKHVASKTAISAVDPHRQAITQTLVTFLDPLRSFHAFVREIGDVITRHNRVLGESHLALTLAAQTLASESPNLLDLEAVTQRFPPANRGPPPTKRLLLTQQQQQADVQLIEMPALDGQVVPAAAAAVAPPKRRGRPPGSKNGSAAASASIAGATQRKRKAQAETPCVTLPSLEIVPPLPAVRLTTGSPGLPKTVFDQATISTSQKRRRMSSAEAGDLTLWPETPWSDPATGANYYNPLTALLLSSTSATSAANTATNPEAATAVPSEL